MRFGARPHTTMHSILYRSTDRAFGQSALVDWISARRLLAAAANTAESGPVEDDEVEPQRNGGGDGVAVSGRCGGLAIEIGDDTRSPGTEL